ncbi:IS5 family transposase [Bradyrhizobium ottawaense]
MRPKRHRTTGSGDLLRARLDQIINMKHELVQLAGKVDWDWIDVEIAPLYSGNGRPGITTRFMIGLLLKHIYGLSDEGVCERWVHDPYFRRRVLPARLSARAFGPEPLAQAARRQAGAAAGREPAGGARGRRVTRPRPQAGHRRYHGAAKGHHLPDRCQAAARGDQRAQPSGEDARDQAAAVLSSHCQDRGHDGGALRSCQAIQTASAAVAHPAQPLEPDHPRYPPQDQGQAVLENAFALPLGRASQIRSQQQRQRGCKLYSFHAPEVECIGKGKAAAPYEFGVKASIVTNNSRAPDGLFVLHARALPDNPYDGHTLRDIIDRTETLTGCAIERAYVDKGYRGHDAQNPRRVFISGQKRGGLRRHQARAAPPLCHRTHHRTPEGRWSPRPLLPQRTRR